MKTLAGIVLLVLAVNGHHSDRLPRDILSSTIMTFYVGHDKEMCLLWNLGRMHRTNLRGGTRARRLKPIPDDHKNSPTLLDRWLNLTQQSNRSSIENTATIPLLDSNIGETETTEAAESRKKLDHVDDELERKQKDTFFHFAALTLQEADECLENEQFEQAYDNYCKSCKLWRRVTPILPADILIYYGQPDTHSAVP